MASLELILTESEWQNLLSYREYAKQLYGVDISRKDECFGDSSLAVPPTQPQQQNSNNSGRIMSPTNLSIAGDIVNNDNCIVRPSPVIVKIQCNSSFSNLEQCRKFAIACSPSNPDFKFTTITLESQPLSEMVKAYLPGIQKSTATFINSYPDSPAISIQGHRTCVDIAQHHINQILQDLKTSETPSPNQNALNSIPYPNSPTNPTKEKSSNVDIDNHRHLLPDRLSPLPTNNMVSSPAKSDDSVFFSESTDHNDQYQDVYNMSDLSNLVTANNYSNVNYSTCPPYNASNAPPFQAYTERCQNTVHRNGSSDEEGVEEILVDNRFSNRINQATKLGFSEKQVARVLKRLGVDSSMEDMMRELVSEPAEADQGDDDALQRDDGTEANLSGEDSDGSEEFDVNDVSNLRHVIIDGSNVAMSHGQKVFSCLGIKIVVDWFKSRGHKNITVFVPQWRKEASRPDAPITDQEILTELEAERTVVFTPSRRVGSTRIVCYDDRYVLQLAVQKDGIVVSNDVYRDLVRERDDFRNVVEKRLLMYSFVQDTFMPPEDPLGRQGPSLDDFLRIKPAVPKNKPQNCPYGKKCTYGTKCRYYHPERRYSSQKMVAEKLKENAELKLKSSKAGGKSGEAGSGQGRQSKQKLVRTVSMLPREDANKMASPADVPFQKPPLHHSKSLVYPSSYLTDLRLKMEQAESADVVVGAVSWSAGDGGNLDQTQTAMGAQEATSNRKSFSHPSPVTSPTPNLPPTFAVKSVKSSLNIPAPEPQDRYLSGHLLVAKKLSDEDNNSGNFFSQHTSRAPGSSQQQERQDMPPCDGRLLSSDSNLSPVSPTRPVSTAHQSDESGDSNSNPWGVGQIYLPPEITTDADLDQVRRTDRKLVSPTNSFVPQAREGRVSSSSPHSPNVQTSDQCDSCPAAFSGNNDVFPHPHPHHFRRSLSTSTPMQSGQYFKPTNNARRKFSLNMGSTAPMEHVHAKVKPHSSVPINQIPFNQNYASTPPTNTPHFQPPFQRTSFDSGISSGGLSGEHLNTTTNSPFSPTDNFISSFQHANNTPAVYSPTNQNPARFTRHHQQQQQHHHHQQQQQHHHHQQQQQQQQQADAAYLSSPSGFPSPSSPWQFSPLPNRMTVQPSFLDQHGNTMTPTTPNMAATPFQPHQQPTVYPPQHFNSMSQPPPTNPSMYAGHPVYTSGMTNPPSPYYPPSMQQGGGAGSPMPYNPPTMSPVSPYPQHTAAGPPPFPFQQQQPPHSNVQDEEAAISVHDPRYDLYYHMSSMFGERVVRTFMNRNPDVRNVKELYSLLSSYKQDTGM